MKAAHGVHTDVRAVRCVLRCACATLRYCVMCAVLHADAHAINTPIYVIPLSGPPPTPAGIYSVFSRPKVEIVSVAQRGSTSGASEAAACLAGCSRGEGRQERPRPSPAPGAEEGRDSKGHLQPRGQRKAPRATRHEVANPHRRSQVGRRRSVASEPAEMRSDRSVTLWR